MRHSKSSKGLSLNLPKPKIGGDFGQRPGDFSDAGRQTSVYRNPIATLGEAVTLQRNAVFIFYVHELCC